MLCSMFFLVCMKGLGLITYPKPTWAMNKKVLPLSLAFVGMVLTGLAALKYLNIPMFKSARRGRERAGRRMAFQTCAGHSFSFRFVFASSPLFPARFAARPP